MKGNYLENSRHGIKCHLLLNNVYAKFKLSRSILHFSVIKKISAYRALLIKQSEGLLELCPHGLWIWILDKELGTELSELRELNGAGAVLINLLNELCQLLGSWSKSHGSKNTW